MEGQGNFVSRSDILTLIILMMICGLVLRVGVRVPGYTFFEDRVELRDSTNPNVRVKGLDFVLFRVEGLGLGFRIWI